MTKRRLFAVAGVSAVTTAVALLVGVQLAPAADRGNVGDDDRGSGSIEFVGRAEQNFLSISIFGYVTHASGLDDASLFATSNALLRNETNAHISFTASTTVTQAFQVLPRPEVSSLFDTDSSGTLTFYFSETPSGRTFSNPDSFKSPTPIASYALRFQDVVAALVGVNTTDPAVSANRGVVDGNGQLCQRTVASFRLGDETHRLGHVGAQQSVFTHGWTVRTNANPPQSFTHFGGHTDTLGDARC